jgi:hypothetical protein
MHESVEWHAKLVDCIRFRNRNGALAAAAALFQHEQDHQEIAIRSSR